MTNRIATVISLILNNKEREYVLQKSVEQKSKKLVKLSKDTERLV